MKIRPTHLLSNQHPLTRSMAFGLALLASSAAMADVRIAAFSEGRGFSSLMAGDLKTAEASLPSSVRAHLPYSDINNLCVLQILQKREAVAVKTCQKALKKVNASTLPTKLRRAVKTEIYSNLAMAQMLAGQIPDARASLASALSLNKVDDAEDSNAIKNQKALQLRLLAAS